MKFSFPKVYIVLVNFNGWADTIECLESLFSNSYSNFQAIVVDNGSKDNSLSHIIQWAKSFKTPHLVKGSLQKEDIPLNFEIVEKTNTKSSSLLTLVKSKENLGFSGGNNLGIKQALTNGDADFIWLLNNDTTVKPSSLEKLVLRAKLHPNALLGSKLLYYSKPDTIQAVAGKYNKCFGLTSHIGENLKDSDQFNNSVKFDYLVGAAIFIPISFFHDVGLLDENYFLYFEELDIREKAKRSGYKLLLCTESIVHHKEGASINGKNVSNFEKSDLADFYYIRNKILITKKYYWYCLPLIYFSLVLSFLNRIKRKQYKRAIQIVRIALNPQKKFES